MKIIATEVASFFLSRLPCLNKIYLPAEAEHKNHNLFKIHTI